MELGVAGLLLLLLGYTVLEAVRMAGSSRQRVARTADQELELRETCKLLREEWKYANTTAATITTLANGNHQVTFQQPIDVGGVPGWGVHEPGLGPDQVARTHPDWSLRYTVADVPEDNGEVDRQLVRQVLDGAGWVQRQETLLAGLREGHSAPEGFAVVRAGAMWEIRLALEAEGTGGGRRTAVQVRAPNRSGAGR